MGPDDNVRRARTNARIGWAAAACVAIAATASLLIAPSIWSGYALLLVAVVALPAMMTRDWTTMVHWPVLSVATIAFVARLAGLYPEAAGYVAVTAFALVVVVELDSFTSIRLSRRFAVCFAVLTTMAVEAIWIIVQFVSDQWLGTDYLTTQTELQLDIVTVTVVSLAIGVVFYWYLTRRERPDSGIDPPGQEAES